MFTSGTLIVHAFGLIDEIKKNWTVDSQYYIVVKSAGFSKNRLHN